MRSIHGAYHLSTPPSFVGKSSHDYDSSDELGSTRLLVQSPPSSPPEPPQSHCDHNDRTQRCSNHPATGHPWLKVCSKCRRSPSSDNTSPDSENELFAFPRIPPILDRLPSIVGRTQKRFKPFEQPHGSLPNTLELRFSQRCLESGETDMSLMDIRESTYQGKDILMHCLKLMPKKIVGQALIAKEADCEYKHLSALAMAWVAEARAQDKQLHEMLVEDELARYAVSTAEASILQRIQGAASCLSEAEEELHADSASHLEHDSSSDFDIND
ncbi:hypothetical protein EV424DRAFT_1348879 [Suillus variegatus]|nr:hypothetical protein EV424DRAFT_1348879 [Suillus variegatus]